MILIILYKAILKAPLERQYLLLLNILLYFRLLLSLSILRQIKMRTIPTELFVKFD